MNKEVNRLRLRLAAGSGNDDLFRFLMDDEDGDESGTLSEKIIKVNRLRIN